MRFRNAVVMTALAMENQLRRRSAGEADAFVDATACRRYAADAAARLERRIAEETAAP